MTVKTASAEKEEKEMTLTQKETGLLADLKTQEQLCIEKYTKYESEACDPQLKTLFSSIKTTEQSHLATINKIMGGEEVKMPSAPPEAKKWNGTASTCSTEQKNKDAFLCKDALTMEKHVSSLYDTSIFEFSNTTLRDTLAHIQKEEQNHGEEIYSYMSANSMY